MTEIDKLNATSAGLIAQKLDAADGNKDGKIEASIWNKFVADKGGKEIDNFIKIDDAINSITTYTQRAKKTEDKTEEEVIKSYNESADKITNTSAEEIEIETTEEVSQANPHPVVLTRPPEPTIIPVEDNRLKPTTNYEYDEKGNVTKEIHKDGFGNLEKTVEYDYGSDGEVKRTSERSYDSKSGKLTNLIRKDAEGNVIDSTDYEYYYNGSMKSEVKKDSNGKKTEFIEYSGVPNTKQAILKRIYNSDEKPTQELSFYNSGEVRRFKTYEYNSTGNLTEYAEYNRYGYRDILDYQNPTPSKSFSRTYNDEGEPTTIYRDAYGKEISAKKWSKS